MWCSQTNQTWANGHAAIYLSASDRGFFLGQLTRHGWDQRSHPFLFENWEFARFTFSKGGAHLAKCVHEFDVEMMMR